jgi:hypothetical protein
VLGALAAPTLDDALVTTLSEVGISSSRGSRSACTCPPPSEVAYSGSRSPDP